MEVRPPGHSSIDKLERSLVSCSKLHGKHCFLRGVLFRVYRYFGCHVYAKHAVTDSLDPSQITYAMVWEDARTLRRALSVTSGDKVICVASGGDNALALLLDDPAFVIAVDYSPAQVALCQLKQVAIKHLLHPQFICLLGIGSEEIDGQSRLEIYQDEVRPHLSRPLKKFWDQRQHLIIHGLVYSGIYEKYFLDFAQLVRPLILSEDKAMDMLSAKTIEEQRAMVDTYCDNFLFRWFIKAYFGDVLVGRCPPFYERCDANVGEHFYERFNHALRNIPVRDNFYLEYMLLGKLSGNNSLPEYMLQKNFSVLKSRIDRVRFVRSDIADFMRDSRTTFNAIDMSNIFDFVPDNEVKSHCDTAVEFAADRARICYWTFVPIKNPTIYQEPLDKQTEVDKEVSDTVNYQERAWFYQTFTLQRVHKPDTLKTTQNGKNTQNGVHHYTRNGVHVL